MSPRARGLFLCSALALGGVAHAQVTQRVSVDSAGSEADDRSGAPTVSADGRYVAFESQATNLVTGDTNGLQDIFVRDLFLGTTIRVSVDSAGLEANGDSSWAAISADGRFVAFASLATNLVAGDTNGVRDVFVHELATGITTRVSLDASGAEASAESDQPAISADGRCVAFQSLAQLVAADGDTDWDVYVLDRSSGQLVLASVGGPGPLGAGASVAAAISADGLRVAFESDAADLVPNDTNGKRDIFVRDLAAGATLRASVDSSGAQCDGFSRAASLSGDGSRVAFESSGTNLVPGDTNGLYDAFVHDLVSGQTLRASVDSSGAQASGYVGRSALSADGRFVVFQSDYPYLVQGDTNGCQDVFLHDLESGWTTRMSVDSTGFEGDYPSQQGVLSADARFVAFSSLATTLVQGDLNGVYDVFVNDRQLVNSPFCFGDGTQATACPCANSGATGHGCENSAGTGGAQLSVTGSVQPDTIVLAAQGELPHALSIALQGDVELNPGASFGDGVRCAGGSLKRLYVANAVNGALVLPGPGDLSVSDRSLALGDPLLPGAQRCYQFYYRDPDQAFCAAPSGNTWNVTNAVRVLW